MYLALSKDKFCINIYTFVNFVLNKYIFLEIYSQVLNLTLNMYEYYRNMRELLALIE